MRCFVEHVSECSPVSRCGQRRWTGRNGEPHLDVRAIRSRWRRGSPRVSTMANSSHFIFLLLFPRPLHERQPSTLGGLRRAVFVRAKQHLSLQRKKETAPIRLRDGILLHGDEGSITRYESHASGHRNRGGEEGLGRHHRCRSGLGRKAARARMS